MKVFCNLIPSFCIELEVSIYNNIPPVNKAERKKLVSKGGIYFYFYYLLRLCRLVFPESLSECPIIIVVNSPCPYVSTQRSVRK